MSGVMKDRNLVVPPQAIVKTAWVDVDVCRLGCRERMDFAAIERAGRELLQLAGGQMFPPVNGRWEGERFVVLDGRHEYLAALALGRTRVLVAWMEADGE